MMKAVVYHTYGSPDVLQRKAALYDLLKKVLDCELLLISVTRVNPAQETVLSSNE
jgi:hypothetical protein